MQVTLLGTYSSAYEGSSAEISPTPPPGGVRGLRSSPGSPPFPHTVRSKIGAKCLGKARAKRPRICAAPTFLHSLHGVKPPSLTF